VAFADDAATEQARQHYQQAQQAYDIGHWDEAIAEYEKAYSFRHDPTFLYNMAQANRRKGDAQRALDLYKNYLVKVPDSPQRAEIEDRIRVLQKQIDKAEQAKLKSQPPVAPIAPGPAAPVIAPPPLAPPPASVPPSAGPAPASQPAPPSSTEPPAPTSAFGEPANQKPAAGAAETPGTGGQPTAAPSGGATAPVGAVTAEAGASQPRGSRGLRIAGIATGAGGLLFMAGGIYMGARASSLSDEVSRDANKQPVGSYQSSKYDDGKLAETLQWVGYGVGAAALVGGAVLYWLGLPKSESTSQSRVSMVALPEVGAGCVGGRMLVLF
jgi:hypothetical protein